MADGLTLFRPPWARLVSWKAAWRALVGSPPQLPPEVTRADLEPLRLALSELEGAVGGLDAQYTHVQNQMDDLKLAVAHGIEHVDRVENRIRAVVRRAKEQLEEAGVTVPGMEAETRQLQLLHEGGGIEEGVPAMHEDVAGFDPTDLPGTWRDEDRAVMGRLAARRG